jgi:hypothetical protein
MAPGGSPREAEVLRLVDEDARFDFDIVELCAVRFNGWPVDEVTASGFR